MNESLSTDDRLLGLIKASEGCELSAYPDPASELGVACRHANVRGRAYQRVSGWENMDGSPWTIGFGHTGSEVTQGLTIDQDQAGAYLQADLKKFEDQVKDLVTVELTEGQFDALVDFQYNTGHLAGSTLLKMVNTGNLGAAAAQFPRWDHANGAVLAGLVTRRAHEEVLFEG